MRKYFNKLYLSIALVVLSLLTMVATTYAWVGLLTSTTFDEFTIDLQEHDTENAEYGIMASLDGINFFEDLGQHITEIKRKILENVGYNVSNMNDNRVKQLFSQHKMDQCSARQYNNLVMGEFRNLYDLETTNYYWFDLYLSVYKIGETTAEDSSKCLDLYLRDHLISAVTDESPEGYYEYNLFNSVTYPTVSDSLFGKKILGDSLVQNAIQPGTTVDGKVKIDIANSCRVAFEKYVAVDKGHLEQYEHGAIHTGLFIYQKHGLYPTYNPDTKVYNFGGVLPNKYNFAREYFSSTHPDFQMRNVPQEIIDRGDIQFADDGVVNHIVVPSDGVTISKMIRFRIYFWFEGWDSNCFDVIDNKTVKLNLSFSTKSPNED